MTYQFDAVRWCKARARTARAVRNFADENSFVQVAREVEGLRTRLAEVEAQRDELQEAVRWERECEGFDTWLIGREVSHEWDEVINCAHSEVDALVGEG